MEIFQSTAKMQQSQTTAPVSTQQANTIQSVQQIQEEQINQDKNAQNTAEQKTSKIQTAEQMEELVEKMNRALNPFNTTLRFGFDNSSKDFYVSVIDTMNNKLLHRFPAEKAEILLPKIQEVNGILFDQRG